MVKTCTILGITMVVWVTGTWSACAESRPIEQLPNDVVRWSTMWVEVPKHMVDVGHNHGPLAALMWGPTKGTAMMIQSTTKELWDAVKPDKRPGHGSRDRELKGLIVRYEF